MIAAHCSSLGACRRPSGPEVLGGVEPDGCARSARSLDGHAPGALGRADGDERAVAAVRARRSPGRSRRAPGRRRGPARRAGRARSGPASSWARLALHLGDGRVVVDAELHQLGAAATRPAARPSSSSGARVDGVLVERELEVARDGRPGGRGAGALEVDHDHAAGVVDLEPVGEAGEQDRLGRRRRRRSGSAASAPRSSRGLSRCQLDEPGRRALRIRASSRCRDQGVRKASRSQTASTSAISGVDLGRQLAVGDPLGEGVERSGRGWRTGGRAETPPASRSKNHCAGQTRIDSSMLAEIGTGRSGSRIGCDGAGGAAGAPPGRRVGGRHQLAPPTSSAASAASRRAAASRSGARHGRGRRPCGAARPPARPATAAAAAGRPGARSSTPSSSRKRDGCSPSSSGDCTALTTRRRRARVQAT